MKIGQYTGLTETGRKRLRNEDALLCGPPLFVVADGMGGAQAGELASRIAVSVFKDGPGSGALDAATRLRAMVHEANRQIFARSQSDPSLTGMGTTVTAAIVEGSCVAIVHVGDSRAYQIRDGKMTQLTDDHSLVAELVRSGRLTPEEAELHPQRAVITRALGTDPTVTADLFSLEARPGDIFLLCTDGLTTMVSDEAIAGTIVKAGGAEEAARALVKAANRAGGEDNITVLLFDFADDAWQPDERPPAPVVNDDEDTLSELDGLPFFDEPVEPARKTPQPSKASAVRPRRAQAGRAFGFGRAALIVSLLLAVAALAIGAAVWGVQRAHFVGADADGSLVVYQGLPWEITSGVKLYREIYVSPVQGYQLSAGERVELFDHSLISESDARERIAPFEREIQLP